MAIAGNLLSYNAESIETDATGWTLRSGNGGISQSSAQALDGTHSLLLTSTGSGTMVVATASSVAVTAGQAYEAWLNVNPSARHSISVSIEWLNASNAVISTVVNGPNSSNANTWSKWVIVGTAPSGAVSANVLLTAVSSVSGETYSFDEMYLGPPVVAISGTPNTSSAYNSILVSGLTGWDTFAIQRTNPDGSQVIIRNANYIATGGADSMAVSDVEAPLGAAVTYTAITQLHNSDGSITTWSVGSAAVAITVANGTAWLKNLTQSALNTQVQIQTLSDVKRAGRQQAYDVIGRQNSVVISDVRGGRTGTLTLMTTASTDMNALNSILNPGGVVFLQFTPADGFADMYFVPGDVTIKRPSSTSTDFTRLWDVAFIEVDSPSGATTSLPGNSYLAVTNFGTYQTLLNDRSTYLAVLNTPYGSGPGGV